MQARTAIALLVALAVPNSAWGAWPPAGRPLEVAAGDQKGPAIATDGAGGAIVAWSDVGLFARRVLASGELDPAWPVNGRALGGVPGGAGTIVIASDGTGGAIVAWEDGRSAETLRDIVAQHVLASGALDPLWPVGGRVLCGAAGAQEDPVIVSDFAGGAIVAWSDRRGGGNALDVYAQHVRGTGEVDWTVDGIAVCALPGPQLLPAIAPDGAGGALVAWSDLRSIATNFDIFVQHVRATGTVDPAWPADGAALSKAPFDQFFPRIASDGAGGALAVWQDARNGFDHTFGNHVLASGVLDARWPVDGLEITHTSVDETQPRIVADGSGGAIVAFLDVRNLHHNTYAVHVLPAGALDPAWPVGGRALSVTTSEQAEPVVTSDGLGGAFVAWEDGPAVAAQHVRANGTLDPVLPAGGRSLGDPLALRGQPAIVPAGAGAIVAWTDRQPGQSTDIYAAQVIETGTIAVPDDPAARAFSFAPPSPNPARGAARFGFDLARAGAVRLALYDAGGRLVRLLVDDRRPAGAQVVSWDGRDARGALVHGVLFARLESGGTAQSRPLIAL